MAELKNEFSWSKSRHETFDECRRKYFYQYYGSWGGWSATAPEPARQLYRLKQIKNLHLEIGTAVHTTIEEILREIRSGRTPSPTAARERVRTLLNQSWLESRGERWRDEPKRYSCLFEHYYGPMPESERIDELRAKAFGCIDRFFALRWYPLIRESRPEDFLSVEDLDSFDLGGVRVFVKPDFALRRDGLHYLFDWKTGKATERDALQLACYAAFAGRKWGVAPDGIRIVIAYLGDAVADERFISAPEIQEALKSINASVERMRSLLVDVASNAARVEDFPQLDDLRVCARCVFREACRPEHSFAR
ncbi:MAG: PD-(D/E)XK nuclease family protein [Planctomycetes bacterium]|nr:PD-(D/E)XK nuclease family protein [Planctomycetota bacterium]